MKLIIQIPCLNEADTLPGTLADLPVEIKGIESIETLVIDDGSYDNTSEVANRLGVNYIIKNKSNVGLARSFHLGLDECLKKGADIIVNTDGDNQYSGKDISKLIEPILKKDADIVIGDRGTKTIAHFSRTKKVIQWFGGIVVRKMAGIWVSDPVSGFRAISRDAAIRLNVLSSFSYTTEMVIQAGKRDMKIMSIPVDTNKKTRESRLFRNIPDFVSKQMITIIRMYAMYQPLRVFFYIGATLSVIGTIPIIRFLYFYFTTGGQGHIQSLVLGGVLLIMGFITFLAGLLADLLSFNRKLHEMSLEKIKRMELNQIKKESKN